LETVKVYNGDIPSSIDGVCGLINDTLEYLKDVCTHLNEDILFEMRVILNELMLNAVKHGNNGDAEKHVKLTAGISGDRCIFFVVEDDGEGYDYRSIMSDEQNVKADNKLFNMKETGRGILIVRNLCERICFNEKGNKIVVLKRL
jgi:serine/threonine-protein kinase RsbW